MTIVIPPEACFSQFCLEMKPFPTRSQAFISLLLVSAAWVACKKQAPAVVETKPADSLTVPVIKPVYTAPFTGEVRVRDYYRVIDSIAYLYDSLLPQTINEYTLVLSNPWVIDRLAVLDYYRAKRAGILIPDQKECFVFMKGDSLRIPDQAMTDSISAKLAETVIDVNIPEYKLRIIEDSVVSRTVSVRVGKNTQRYLETAGHDVNLRTPIGVGEIVRIERYALWMNPVDGHRYTSTGRDDGNRTALPLIPWLEPSINGVRWGTLIHPTTNPVTLGRASSNGCVGVKEGDMWHIYYHAPIGTKVVFRYDLEVNDTLKLRDIYGLGDK
jgi:L,D-transpeptidase ErfK/SrfK